MIRNRLTAAALGIGIGAALALVACSEDPAQPGGLGEDDVAEVRGSVLLETGAGLPGATVELARAGAVARSATTDSKGRYAIGVPEAGTWELRLAPPAGYALPPEHPGVVSVEVAADQVVTVDIEAAHGLAVEVNAHTPQDSLGVAGVVVRAIPAGESEPAAVGTTESIEMDGFAYSVALLAVPPGTYDVLIDIPDGYVLSPAFTNPQRVEVRAESSTWVGFGLAAEE